MKRFFMLLFSMAVFTACDNNTKKETTKESVMNTDLLQQNLKGKVKSITETSVNIDSSGAEKPGGVTNYISFDEKGYQTSFLGKDSSGKVVSEQFSLRNDAGMVTEFGSKKDGKLMSRVVTDISPEGKYTGGKRYDSTDKQDGYYKDLMQNEYSIVYSGKLYNMNDKLMETFDMKYDKNQFLGGKVTDSTGKATYEGTAKVNDKGDISEESYTYVENGQSKTEKKTYQYDQYDEKGNWTQQTTYDDKGKRTKVVKRVITYYE
jgi:hypothetical protein